MRRMAVLFALLLAACGGDGDGEPASPTTTVIPTTTVMAASTSTSVAPPVSGSTSTSTTRGSGSVLSATSTVDLRGLGPVRIGMTVAEASDAAGTRMPARPGGRSECGYVQPEGGPEGVSFMVVSGRIARVDVTAGPVKTLSGASVGDTEAQVQGRYGGRLQSSPHKYVAGGHYLTLVPADASDANFRVMFETDGSKVTRYRSGKQPEVSFVEGCS